jgi:hypothetical protein
VWHEDGPVLQALSRAGLSRARRAEDVLMMDQSEEERRYKFILQHFAELQRYLLMAGERLTALENEVRRLAEKVEHE